MYLVADNIKQADPDTNLTPPPPQASATSPGVQLSPAPPQLPHVTSNLPQSSLPQSRQAAAVPVSQAPSPREMANHMPRLPGQGIIRQPTSQYEFALNQMKNRKVSFEQRFFACSVFQE